MNVSKKWESYEEVSQYLLNEIAEKFGMDRFEGKQKIKGGKTGAKWEVDGKGVSDKEGIFLILECRRYTKSCQSQEKVGGLAYRIMDTGAAGGIFVTPLGLQEGGQKIASVENIKSVLLSEDSTRFSYRMILEFLDEVRVGLEDSVKFTDSASVQIEQCFEDRLSISDSFNITVTEK